MFTQDDIRNIAQQIEKNGRQTYLNAAKMVKEPELAELLYKMAEDEQRHGSWFAELPVRTVLSEEEREMKAVGKALLQEMVRDKTFSLDEKQLSEASSVAEILIQAQGFEEDTVLFYEMLLGFVDDEATHKQLLCIIEEERRHSAELAALLEKTRVNASTDDL